SWALGCLGAQPCHGEGERLKPEPSSTAIFGGRTPSAVERLEADKAKYVKTQQVINSRPKQNGPRKLLPSPQSPVARKGSSKRLLRPDSLIIYRQKRDCTTVNTENAKGSGLVRRLFQGPLRDKLPSSPSSRGLGDGQQGPERDETPMVWVPVEKEGARTQSSAGGIFSPNVNPVAQPPRSSQTHLPSPESRPGPREAKRELGRGCSLPLSEKERFFNYCGLDRDLVEVLGRERFGPAGWDVASSLLLGSAGSAGSERSGPAHSSGCEAGPDAEELGARCCSTVSIIERNARVIKWLYGCQRAWAMARESTV
uniref:Family with sequence similarity 110 member D n=1 Tax=Chelonoidis abingdonii TaxID=106734 RepID=A0A8C0IRK7_CHEAB